MFKLCFLLLLAIINPIATQQKHAPIRLLYLEELPRWEYRYLKNALVRDPDVMANIWLFSSDIDFRHPKSPKAPILKKFPTKKQLSQYDCIILGDVPTYNLEPDQRNLIDFVNAGGGLIIIAGPHSTKNYASKQFKSILPMVPDISAKASIETNMQYLKLTPKGKKHPLMRLLAHSKDNTKLWEERLGAYYWHLPMAKEKPGVMVLARKGKKPLIAIKKHGKGKVFFTATDSSWRWRFYCGDLLFYMYWKQVIYEVTNDKRLASNSRIKEKIDFKKLPKLPLLENVKNLKD